MLGHTRLGVRWHEVVRRLVARLLHDDSGVTPLQHFVAAAALALVAAAASRPIAGVVASLSYRIRVIAMLAKP